ncbi:hypothetical protein D8T51_04070 [Vibrio vulnificus]|nr:hypothetical protein D8T52_07665 [Vibrio vulnificus]RZP83424.1 hypothetical protein D8T51_04070 [Vibrio vulnificus]
MYNTFKVQKYNTQFPSSASLSLSFYQVVTSVENQSKRNCTFFVYAADKGCNFDQFSTKSSFSMEEKSEGVIMPSYFQGSRIIQSSAYD